MKLLRALAPALALLAWAPAANAAERDFPRSFLWGTAIAGLQSEAGGRPANADPRSDWWVWSHDAQNIQKGWVSGDLIETRARALESLPPRHRPRRGTAAL